MTKFSTRRAASRSLRVDGAQAVDCLAICRSRPKGWIPAALIVLVLAAALQVDRLEGASLQGLVVDPKGMAVTDARLRLFERISGELRKTRSKGDGSYAFLNIPEGDYLIECDASESALTGFRQVEVRGDEAMDLPLAVSGGKVEIVVTSSSTPLSLREIGKALDVVDSEHLSLRNEFALSEAIRIIPGIRVQQLRGPGSLTTVQTRGLRNHDTAVLIDGLRFRDAASIQGDASAFYSDMNLVGTERVEFLRGSGSSLYGSHAIGGLMNISTQQGGGRTHGELRAEGGGLGMLRSVARVGGGIAEDRFVYSLGGSHLNVTRGHRGGSPYRNSTVRGFAKYNFTPSLSISGRVWGADAFLGLTESPAFTEAITANFPASGIVPARALPQDQLELFEQRKPFAAGTATFIPSQIDPDNRKVSSYLATAVFLHHQLATESSFRVSYQHVETNRSLQDGPGGPGPYDPAISNDSRFDGQTHSLLARTDHRVGASNLVSLGYEFDGERYDNFNTDESPAPVSSRVTIDQASHAVFGQDQVRLLDGSLHLSMSGRSQFFRLGSPTFSGTTSPYAETESEGPGNAYTGDFSVAYLIRHSQTKVRAHAGNAFRAPSLYERFGGAFSSWSGGFSYWGDPRLAPERSVAVDGGIDQWLFGSKVRASATFFYTNLQETVIFDFASFPADDIFGRYGGYRNGMGGIARGFEVSSRITPNSTTSLRGSYAFTNSDSRTPTIGTDYFQVPGVSESVFTMTATQWIRKRFNVTFDLFAVSDYILSPWGALGRKLVFNGPVKADLVLRYEIPLGDAKRMEFYGKAENAFNAEYYEDGFGTPGLWVIGGLRYSF